MKVSAQDTTVFYVGGSLGMNTLTGDQSYSSQQVGLTSLEGAHHVKTSSWLGGLYGSMLMRAGPLKLGGELGLRFTRLDNKNSHSTKGLTPGQAGIEIQSRLKHTHSLYVAALIAWPITWCDIFLALGGTWGRFTQELVRWNNGVYSETITAKEGALGGLIGVGFQKQVGAVSLRVSYDVALYPTLSDTRKSPTYPNYITVTQVTQKPKVHSFLLGISWAF